MTGPEDTLSGMFKSFGMGSGQNVTKMLNALIISTQINMLKTLRHELDMNIKKLTSESKSGMAYDASLDPYKILGVEQSATKEEIKKAFRQKAWKAHPDHGGSQEDMIKVNAAFEAIRQFRGWK